MQTTPATIALPVSDAAKAVGRTPSYLYQEIRAGRLRAYRPPRPTRERPDRVGQYLVLPEDLRDWVRASTTDQPQLSFRL
jgi:hypothetical protein